MVSLLKVNHQQHFAVFFSGIRPNDRTVHRKSSFISMSSTSPTTIQHLHSTLSSSSNHNLDIPIMVNGCSGKMGKAVIKAADSAGLNIVPLSFGSAVENGKTVQVCGKDILIHGPDDRENVLASVFDEHPNLVVVDYTVPTAVNDNAELYCKVGVPFVMGTTGGDRDRLYKTVEDSKVYAVISPQMGKQVVAFLAAMEIMAEQFPGAFSGYSLQVSFSLNLGIFLGGEDGGSSSFNSLILISFLLMVISSYHLEEYSTQLSHTSKYKIIVLIKNKYKTIMELQLPFI
nr:4-hydroxy-tetrahydrodipicolinate reductase 1, chloroplastic-like [Quercus suber]